MVLLRRRRTVSRLQRRPPRPPTPRAGISPAPPGNSPRARGGARNLFEFTTTKTECHDTPQCSSYERSQPAPRRTGESSVRAPKRAAAGVSRPRPRTPSRRPARRRNAPLPAFRVRARERRRFGRRAVETRRQRRFARAQSASQPAARSSACARCETRFFSTAVISANVISAGS